jgi:hypothetical protein
MLHSLGGVADAIPSIPLQKLFVELAKQGAAMPGQSTLSRILYATEYQPDETATSMESELSVKVFHAAIVQQ